MPQQLLEKSPLSFNTSQGQIPKGQVVIVLEGREASPGKVVNTEQGQSYKIINAVTKEVVKPLKVERVAKKLKVTLADGEILELMNFFDDGQVQRAEFLLSTSDSACPIVIIESALASAQAPVLDANGNELLWSADASSAQMCLYAASAAFTPAGLPIVAEAAGLGPVGVFQAGVLGLAAAGGGGGHGGGVGVGASNSRFVQGVITAGDVVASNDLRVEVYSIASNGAEALLNTGAADAGGAYRINIGSYSGAVRVRVINTGTQDDHLDEATGKTTQLSAALEALGMATGLSTVINITPVTHLASLKNTAPTSENIATINAAVGDAFGLRDITTAFVITITNSLYGTTTKDNSRNYGDVLAALSGMDASPPRRRPHQHRRHASHRKPVLQRQQRRCGQSRLCQHPGQHQL